jgi:hypothetical protein
LILDPEEIYALAQHMRSYKLHTGVLLTGTIGLDKNLLKLWKNIFMGGYLIEPHMPELPDFRNYFLHKLKVREDISQNINVHFFCQFHFCTIFV